jgi:hypothetical protein
VDSLKDLRRHCLAVQGCKGLPYAIERYALFDNSWHAMSFDGNSWQ